MGESAEDAITRVDENIATNLRHYREDRGLSQDDLARQMTARGHRFTQATIWKIETQQRPLRVNELAALADTLDLPNWADLTADPQAAQHDAQLRRINRRAHDAYQQIQAATQEYLRAQLDLLWAAKQAHDAGLDVYEVRTSWLTMLPEEAVIEARIEWEREDKAGEELAVEVDRVVQALREHGYDPRPPSLDEISTEPAGTLQTWTPPQ